MKKLSLVIASLWLSLASAAAQQQMPALGVAAAVSGTDLLAIYQGAAPLKKMTAAQMAAYVYGLTSGDATASGVGALTLATVNANVGSFGSATNCVSFTTNAKGLITAASQATCTPAVGSVTGWGTGVQAAVAAALNSSTGLVGALTPTNNNCVVGNGTAWTSAACPGGGGGVSSIAGNTGAFTLNATSGITNSTNDIILSQASSSQFGAVKVDGTTITAASGVISAASPTATPSLQTGTNYAFQSSDRAKVIYLSNAANQIPTIAQATGSFGAGWYTTVCNIAAGTQTITPTTSTIGGAPTLVLPAGSAAAPVCTGIVSDGTNYLLVPDYTTNATLLTSGTVNAARLPFGTGVATAAAANLSAAGGLTTTIGSGTASLGTSAITSGSCATVVTVATSNVATTDVISFTPNADITAVTGYAPVTTGGLSIYPYPTSGNVNFKVCNPTSSSITPGAVTLNFRVTR